MVITLYDYEFLQFHERRNDRRNNTLPFVRGTVDRQFPKFPIDHVRPTMETRCCKVLFPSYSKKKTAEDTLVPPLWGKREKMFFLALFVHAAVRGESCAFTLKIVNTLINNSSRDDRPSISTSNQPTANPVRDGQGGECR